MAEPTGVPCPLCGELLPEGAESCPNCGAAASEPALRGLMQAFQIDSAKAHELFRTGVRSAQDLQGRSVDDVLKARESAVLYLCTYCGAFVSSTDKVCGKCGAGLEEEGAGLDELLKGGDTMPCPACGDTIPADALVCPTCKTEIAEEIVGPEPTTVLCPNCGAPTFQDQEVCDSCGRPLQGVPAAPAKEEAAETAEAPVAEEEIEGLEELAEAAAPQAEAERVAADLDELAHEIVSEAAPEEAAVAPAPPVPARAVRSTAELPLTRFVAPRRPRLSTAERLREVDLVSALAAFAPAAYASANPSEVGGWAVFAAFAAIFAAAFALLFFDPAIVRMHRRGYLLAAVGGLAVLIVPLHSAAMIALPEAVDTALVIFGIALIAAGAYPFRGLPAAHVPWLAALPAFVTLAAATAVGRPTGSAAVSAGTWVALAAVTTASALLVLRVRWTDARVAAAVRRAEDLATKRDYRGAIKELDRAIRLTGEKGSDAPWYSKGAALVVLGQYEEAMACIDTALRINPRNEVAWVNKGNALVRMGRLVDALRCYNSAIKVNPRYEVAWNNKGNALARLGKFDDALRCYERALVIDASYRGAWVNKGYVLAKIGDFEAAAKCADEALRLGGPGGVAA